MLELWLAKKILLEPALEDKTGEKWSTKGIIDGASGKPTPAEKSPLSGPNSKAIDLDKVKAKSRFGEGLEGPKSKSQNDKSTPLFRSANAGKQKVDGPKGMSSIGGIGGLSAINAR